LARLAERLPPGALLFDAESLALYGQDVAGPDPVTCSDNTFQPKSSTHEVIGFYPAGKHAVLPVSNIRWDKLTRVIYAFAIPRPDGTLDVSSLTRADSLANTAHAERVEVYLSIGGGSGSGNFPILAANADTRQTFVQEVQHFLGSHCFQGVDIDWEQWTKDSNNVPNASEKTNLVTLLQELRSALHPQGLKISIDVYPSNWYGQHYDDSVPSLVDYIHVMAYDFSGPWSAPGHHSSYEQAIGSDSQISSTGLSYWTQYRQWPKDKTILGLPFYGRDFDNNGGIGIAYRDILNQYAQAPTTDHVANIYYNGRQTITDKTQFVVNNDYPGVMIWEISHDTHDVNTSLLDAIDQAINQ